MSNPKSVTQQSAPSGSTSITTTTVAMDVYKVNTQQTAPVSRFMHLPPELRLAVYEAALVQPHPLSIRSSPPQRR